MQETKKLIKEEEQDFFKKLTERVGAVNMQVKYQTNYRYQSEASAMWSRECKKIC